MSELYLRRYSLVVANPSKALDLSPSANGPNLRIRFEIKQADIQTPNTARITIYNLSDTTAQLIRKEFTRVVLQAGYADAYGTIFDGTIVQVRQGREDQTTTYLEINAADGDEALNFATINTTLAAGSTFKDRVAALQAAMTAQGVKPGYMPPAAPANDAPLPRGKVMYGMARDHLRQQAFETGQTYSVQNGQLVFVPLSGFIPSEAVVMNSTTGMLGMPEQTEDGIRVRSLLNPLLGIGSKLQIAETDIVQASLGLGLQAGPTNSQLPGTSSDGIYRIYVIEQTGDTRGPEWYSDIVCLSTDPTKQGLLSPAVIARGTLGAPGG